MQSICKLILINSILSYVNVHFWIKIVWIHWQIRLNIICFDFPGNCLIIIGIAIKNDTSNKWSHKLRVEINDSKQRNNGHLRFSLFSTAFLQMSRSLTLLYSFSMDTTRLISSRSLPTSSRCKVHLSVLSASCKRFFRMRKKALSGHHTKPRQNTIGTTRPIIDIGNLTETMFSRYKKCYNF